MIPRSPEAIIQAAIMDADRNDLFVEGIHDKMVLEFLSEPNRNHAIRIFPIDEIAEIGESENGAKGRLLKLAHFASRESATNLKFFVDRDLDCFVGDDLPNNTWKTDFPDLEGYLINDKTVSKILKLCYNTERLDASVFLASLMSICRKTGLLRVFSRRKKLDLPITKTNKTKCITLKSGIITFDFDRFFTAVLQGAGQKLSKKTTLLRGFDALKKELADEPSENLVRGKDFIEISIIALRRYGIESKEFEQILWGTLESSIIPNYPALDCVVKFLSRTIEPENSHVPV